MTGLDIQGAIVRRTIYLAAIVAVGVAVFVSGVAWLAGGRWRIWRG